MVVSYRYGRRSIYLKFNHVHVRTCMCSPLSPVSCIAMLSSQPHLHMCVCTDGDPPLHLGRAGSSDCVPLQCSTCEPYQNEQLTAPSGTTFTARIGPSGDVRGYIGITGEENPLISWIHMYSSLVRICYIFINSRRACAARVTVVVLSFILSVCLSVCLPVCYHVFCRYVQQDGQ